MWVLIVLLSNEGSGKLVQMCRLARGIAARIHKEWIKMKTHNKNKTSSPLGRSSWAFKRVFCVYAISTVNFLIF